MADNPTNTEVEKLVQELESLNQLIYQTIVLRDSRLKALRSICRHPRVTEVNYQTETTYSYCKPPIRLCLTCSIEEDGWGCGYHVLNDAPGRTVNVISDHDKFFSLRAPGPRALVGPNAEVREERLANA